MPPELHPNLQKRLEALEAQFLDLGEQLLSPEVMADHRQVRALSIKRAAVEELVSQYRTFRALAHEAAELRQVMDDHAADLDLAALAREELPAIDERLAALVRSIQKQLVTSDERGVGSVIVEIRGGVGGDEAAIWAGDLLQMYQRYAQSRAWTVEILQASPGEQGGFKNIVLSIAGEGVWAELAFEGGTHQVKRVPATETQGRVHTSTATVAVLPEPEEIEVKIAPEDVKEMVTTAQGPGGQNVNKVATAVHLIHLPTGIEVRMQETKSQLQNRQKAWQLLRARLYERQQAEAHAARAEARNSMIGSASRSEKIRTYRWKENVVVDHRLEGTERGFNLSDIMSGRLTPLLEALTEQETARRLAAM